MTKLENLIGSIVIFLLWRKNYNLGKNLRGKVYSFNNNNNNNNNNKCAMRKQRKQLKPK
jgi:hypothetical protein